MKFTLKYPEYGEKKEATASIAEDKKYLSFFVLMARRSILATYLGGKRTVGSSDSSAYP